MWIYLRGGKDENLRDRCTRPYNTYHSMRPVVVFFYVVKVGGAVESCIIPIQLAQPA